jgi:epoxyqueuosine reductase
MGYTELVRYTGGEYARREENKYLSENRLREWAAQRHYGVAWGPLTVARDAGDEITRRWVDGQLDEAFYRCELAPLDSGETPTRGSVLVVAKPCPASRVTFELPGGPLDALLPPTYFRYRATFEDVRQDLVAHALPGARVEHLAGPLKTIASRLGLVRYGRNNITYLAGAGSYIQLCGFVTDASLPSDAVSVRGPQLLDECEGCHQCQRACPTRAIDSDRLLLHAERCLTLLNERIDPWPDWVPTRAHRCLIGCLLCQRACPANPELPVEETGVRFTEGETRDLLNAAEEGAERDETGLRVKLAWLGRSDPESLLGRNLRALVEARGSAGSVAGRVGARPTPVSRG